MNRLLIWIIPLTLLCMTKGFSISPAAPAAQLPDRPVIVAHRGLSSKAPENTMSAFSLALSMEADFIELDVHLSKDGVPIVIHDPVLNRTTNATIPLEVKDLTIEELQNFDAGSWFSPRFSGEQLPTLQKVLSEFSGKIGIFIEIKEGTEPIEALVNQVVEVVSNYPGTEEHPVIQGSFSIQASEQLLSYKTSSPLLGISETLEDAQEHISLGIRHIVLSAEEVTEETIELLHQQNIALWSYTVDDPKLAQQFSDWGIDGIISNRAHRYL
jgi:glycerophosphoryl diester phosphodiesterase